MKLTDEDRRWLIIRMIDGEEMLAPADSKTDRRFAKLAKAGVLTCCDDMFGYHYYSFTDEGRAAVAR